MNEQWKMVPIEPTAEMHDAARDWSIERYGKAVGSDGSSGCYAAMLAAAPVPPAGDVEVRPIGYVSKSVIDELSAGNHVPACITSSSKSRTNQHPGPDFIREIAIFDSSHVSRLTAEREALQQRLNIADQRVCDLTTERSGLAAELSHVREERDSYQRVGIQAQSELTKALSWLGHAKPLLHSGGFNLAADDIGNYLAHQSVPAAKGGACWSCKRPVTMAQWREADGNCPHCGVEIDEAEGLKP